MAIKTQRNQNSTQFMVQEQEQRIWTIEKSNLASIASLIGGNSKESC